MTFEKHNGDDPSREHESDESRVSPSDPCENLTEIDSPLHVDDIEIINQSDHIPEEFKGTQKRHPLIYRGKPAIKRTFNDSDKIALKLFEQECLEMIKNQKLGSRILVDKLIDYEDKLKQVAAETRMSVDRVVKNCDVLTPQMLHGFVVDMAYARFVSDYSKLSANHKYEIFGHFFNDEKKKPKP